MRRHAEDAGEEPEEVEGAQAGLGRGAFEIDRLMRLRFYEEALKALGHVLCSRDEGSAGLGPKGEPALWLYAAGKGAACPGVHVAFRARDRAQVDRFHRAGREAGGRDNGKPGLRADYSSTYYAAFLLDPDDNNVEAVCLS